MASKNSLQCKDLMMSSLTAYYKKNPEHRRLFHNILGGDSPLSLRLIDWFVTHYARTMNVSYWINERTRALIETPTSADIADDFRKFNLYLEYRAQLQSYTKMFFDPFRRYERVTMVLETEPEMVHVETTVGQLNFFRWALSNNVLDYIAKHLVKIEESMASFQKSGGNGVGAGAGASSGAGAGASAGTVPTKKKHSRMQQPIQTISHTQCFIRFD